MFQELKGKKLLFISTKNKDYIRNTQELRILGESADFLNIICFSDKNYLIRLIKVFLKLLFTNHKKYDAVFVGFAPQLILPFWNWKLKKRKVYIDFFISMYDTFCFDRQKVKPNSIMGKLLLFLDKKTLRKADVIVADTKAHSEYFCAVLGAAPEKLRILYLEANKDIYYPHVIEKPDEVKDKFVVLYFGSILPLQGVDIVLDAALKLENKQNICFYIIGPVEDKLKTAGGENIYYIPWMKQEKLSDYIAFSDLCLAGHFCADIDKAKRTIPGKAYIYRAMEKPMILGDGPANHELFSEDQNQIYFVKMGDSQALAEKILEIQRKEEKK